MRRRRSNESEPILSIVANRVGDGCAAAADRPERRQTVTGRQRHGPFRGQLKERRRQGVVGGQRSQLGDGLATVSDDQSSSFSNPLKVCPEPGLQFARADDIACHVVIVTTWHEGVKYATWAALRRPRWWPMTYDLSPKTYDRPLLKCR